jgi:hypothetical protein
MPDDQQPPPRSGGAVTRRALLGVVVGAGVLAGAGALASRLLTGGQPSPTPHPTSGPNRSDTPTPASTPGSRADGLLVDRLVQRPGFTVAHRGGSLDWPEMSMVGYRESVRLGANALEISLARTSDGVWFGLHDATLDRTSGTSGFVAAQHTWSEVQAHTITAGETNDPRQQPQPYLRFEELVAAYGRTHTIFVDPKVVPTDHLGELFSLMAAVPDPANTFVAKGYCTAQAWPLDAAARGLRTWGYYYGAELAADPAMLATTQERWSWLGLDYEAAPDAWRTLNATGKPVLAHIVPSRADADRALDLGAAGLVVSGVREVLGG